MPPLGAYAGAMSSLVIRTPTGDGGNEQYAPLRHASTLAANELHDAARFPTTLLVTLMAKVCLKHLNSLEVYDSDILISHLDCRPKGTAIITVSNHTSMLDDPAVIAAMMPWRFAKPSLARWSLCTQEYSYLEGKIASTFFFSGKTLPVKRGGGINHEMMEAFFDKVQAGDPERERIGRLKWGVGKLIARASQRPIVVPFYHTGMHNVLPQNERHELISIIPNVNQLIQVRVGNPIVFDDLFQQYEHDVVDGAAAPWTTEEREKALYSAITRRIEDALLELAQQTAVSGVAAYGVGLAALAVDAPVADRGDGQYDAERRDPVFPRWVHDLGRLPTTTLATLVAKVYLTKLNSLEMHNNDILLKHLDERPAGTSLITVCNHTATVDDPALLAAMLPWRFVLPSLARWSLCSQEYCYLKGSKVLSTFFFSAKTLPVKRGAGIDHKMMEDFFEKVQDGEWVHIFPEGKIDQHHVLGGRGSPERERIGRLKWGVGKLIARASQRPVVVPFYHTNMQKVMPQNERNQLNSMIPATNIRLGVRVGEPISFDDLFEKYEQSVVDGATAPWTTQEREKELYSAITRRIEDALLQLAKESGVDESQL
ncbi:TPA: hypothetical protein N0F65_008076 [Lagenidium giganteum]|uniref:Phospholipid/glycerol acyltransferase domain-containing protein n=1 Tax=Lagenidium giganteum TaxID=4803 RepID=A0AAV2YR06_9STRA|nr:TPA: hypothetical protein N0F65_008076 [Lagenidium giganteum]